MSAAVDYKVVRQRPAKVTNGRDAVQTSPVLPLSEYHGVTLMAWERRAVTLAIHRQYSRSDLIWRGERANGDTLILVPSDSQPGHYYPVTVHPIAHPSCGCVAGSYAQPCRHAGAALGLWAERREVERGAARQAYAEEFDVHCSASGGWW